MCLPGSRMSRSKVTRLAFVIVLVSFLLSTFVSLWSLHIMSERNKQELARVLAARIYDSIIGELSEPIVVARTMSNDSFLIDLLKAEDRLTPEEAESAMKTYLSGIREGLNYEAVFVVSDASRRYYSYKGFNKLIDPEKEERDRWYTDFLSQDTDYDFDVDSDEVSHDVWTVFLDSRITDSENRILGVCGVGMQMSRSREMFQRLENEYHVKIDLVDPDGLIQVDTDESRIENTYIENARLSSGGDYVYEKLDGGGFIVSKYIEKLGWYLVVQSSGGTEWPELMNVIVLNVGLCIFVMVLMVLAVRIIALRTIALTNASFRDQDTGLFNRRAFEEEKLTLQQAPPDESFVYVTIDINGLKTANDTLGHTAGDELIRGTADCLRRVFGPYGKIFRIGGDEFAAMLHVGEEELERLQRELETAVSEWTGEQVRSLSVSTGYVSAREFPSEDLAEIGRISDERMYAAKTEYYRRSGIERRKT